MNGCVIIPAGGVGSRFGGNLPKQFIDLQGKPVIHHSILQFDNIETIKHIIIPVNSKWENIIFLYQYKKDIILVKEGTERQDSVRNALNYASSLDIDYILIHDAVRPCVSNALINRVIEATMLYGSAVPGIIPNDTIKMSDDNSYVNNTLPRASLRAIQTPQGFRKDIIIEAYKKAEIDGIMGTDDAFLVEQVGFPVKIVEGDKENIKITSQIDLYCCQAILSK